MNKFIILLLICFVTYGCNINEEYDSYDQEELIYNLEQGRELIGNWQGYLTYTENNQNFKHKVSAAFDSSYRLTIKIDTSIVSGEFMYYENLFFRANDKVADSIGWPLFPSNVNAKDKILKSESVIFNKKKLKSDSIILESDNFNGKLFLKKI